MLTIQTCTGLVTYEEQGTGVPLVLLHANPGDLHHFDGIIPSLEPFLESISSERNTHVPSNPSGTH